MILFNLSSTSIVWNSQMMKHECFMHIIFPPHYWVKFVKETYLLADGKKYLVKSCDGLKLDEEHYMPGSGREDVVFHFAPLPKKTRKFDFLEGDGKQNFKILGIESIDTRIKRLFSSLWRNDATGDWEIGQRRWIS